jgi:hypothetical protein
MITESSFLRKVLVNRLYRWEGINHKNTSRLLKRGFINYFTEECSSHFRIVNS